ncbi:hypothetical protein GCM10009001_22570 [Virgibacillus siamensis]|uniref:Sulfotransferase family protein n=1 Tax=Virgibacillus siamensis TaxID=480071 RepID=A0ABN1G620_9BACI
MDSKKFVFICGLHRSGTTILFKLLREQDQISGFSGTGVPRDEGQHLQSVYPSAKKVGGTGNFAFNKKARLDETSELITPENKEQLLSEWGKHWDLSKDILLEKSPPNIIRTRFLQEMFPESYFIIIKRHPVAVSFATDSFSKKTFELERLLEHWVECHRQAEQDIPYLKNVMTIKYEDLVADPEKFMGDISELVRFNADDITLNVKSNTNDKYFKQWRELPQDVRKSLEEKFEEQINKYGYSFKDVQ